MSAKNPGTGYKRGEAHHRAKLTGEQVAKIRRMYRPGVVGYKTLADEFGVSWSTIRSIVKHWGYA